MCCYRDVKNFERFYLIIQSILYLAVCQLKLLKEELIESAKKPPDEEKEISESNIDNNEKDDKELEEDIIDDNEKSPKEMIENDTIEVCIRNKSSSTESENGEVWSMQQKEKLMHIVSKFFLLNFPLYLACKHSTLSRLDELTAQEISSLSSYCDLHDTEIPAYLLRNVSLFCKFGGVCAMAAVFEYATPATMPLSMAHAIVAAVGNLKLWLNFRAAAQLFIPLRSKILKYMCILEDKDLRVPAVKSMAGEKVILFK